MNKRSKKTAKSNINTRKGTNMACPPTPRQHLPKQKQENRRLNMPVLGEHGGVPECLQKRQSCRSFYHPPRGRAQRTWGRGQL
ncbi:hypothetical protein HanPI659440_Chr05g0202031 [Helianthus annuus]|nr:hypothetical protein HanPI659440_Chr05g0202031 [Helianthus annuus]